MDLDKLMAVQSGQQPKSIAAPNEHSICRFDRRSRITPAMHADDLNPQRGHCRTDHGRVSI